MARAPAPSAPSASVTTWAEWLRKAHDVPVWSSLAAWKESKRVPPVLLLTGAPGSGKREMATEIARILLCERAGFSEPPTEEASLFGGGGDMFGGASAAAEVATGGADGGIGACGACSACERAASRNWIDFAVIEPEKDAETLKIDQFRAVKESLGRSSFGGSFRIFLIPEAERMTIQAANSLLKILEEPPPGWIFLLTASDPSLLPSTVVSRCQMLRLRPLSEASLRAWLAGPGRDRELPPDRANAVIPLAQGSFRRLVELCDDEAWEKRAIVLEFLQRPQAALGPLIDWASGSTRSLSLLLDQFELLLSDLVRTAAEPGPIRNADARKTLETHRENARKRFGSPERARAFWVERSERLFRMRREIHTPMNAKLLLQDFLLPWMG